MKSFKEFSQDEKLVEQYHTEALTIAQRLKKSRMFKRIAAKIKLGRKRASKKIITDPKKLFKRAVKQQRMKTAKKLLKGKSYFDLSPARKMEIEKKLDKMRGRITTLAKKLLPSIRKKEKNLVLHGMVSTLPGLYAGIPKLILPHKRLPRFFKDYDGSFSCYGRDMYVFLCPNGKEQLDTLDTYLTSPTMVGA